jgi:uncharacterized protein (DUF1684 family)
MSNLDEFRREKDEFFKNNRQSPLDKEQKNQFNGLSYYPENPALRLELTLERNPDPEMVAIATSTGDERDYWHVGQVRFKVKG